MIFSVTGFAATSKIQFNILCDIGHLTTAEQQVECPQLIERVLQNMGCGGEVSSCVRISPGAPDSGENCGVINSQCSVPVVHYKPVCRKQASSKYFRDFDEQTTHDSPLRLTKIYDMGVNVEFLCL